MKTKIVWLNALIENKEKNRKKLDVPIVTKPTETRHNCENRILYRKGGYHPVKIGDSFRNRYTVIAKLGWGTFSTVWLCLDLQERQFIALKIVQSAPETTIAALHEVEMLTRAKSRKSDASPQKIVRLLDAFTTTGVNGTHICISLDVLGHNLLEVIRRSDYKGLPLTSVKSILRQVLEALDYLHTTCNMIHTDVKPENICLDESEVLNKLAIRRRTVVHEVPVTLADLGNACCVNRHLNRCIQSRPYRGPEVILGLDYQCNADVWSTACTAFELATGHYLFPPGSRGCSDDKYCLAVITGLLGDVPKRIAFASEYSRRFFNGEGKLRFVPANVDSRGIVERLTQGFQWDVSDARLFGEFLLPMLAMDPNERSSAKDCLGHKWLEC